jgi:hypothetical protein
MQTRILGESISHCRHCCQRRCQGDGTDSHAGKFTIFTERGTTAQTLKAQPNKIRVESSASERYEEKLVAQGQDRLRLCKPLVAWVTDLHACVVRQLTGRIRAANATGSGRRVFLIKRVLPSFADFQNDMESRANLPSRGPNLCNVIGFPPNDSHSAMQAGANPSIVGVGDSGQRGHEHPALDKAGAHPTPNSAVRGLWRQLFQTARSSVIRNPGAELQKCTVIIRPKIAAQMELRQRNWLVTAH